jgi:hypothetical protein
MKVITRIQIWAALVEAAALPASLCLDLLLLEAGWETATGAGLDIRVSAEDDDGEPWLLVTPLDGLSNPGLVVWVAGQGSLSFGRSSRRTCAPRANVVVR